jgi:sugar phosphate isomerase/epimerase
VLIYVVLNDHKNRITKAERKGIIMKKRIVTTTSVFQPGYPAIKAADRLAALGFEALDMALDYWTEPGSPFMGDEYLQWAEKLREHAEKTGMPYTHSHAPSEAGNDPTVERAIETAGILGACYIVVHPVCRENGKIIETAEQFIRVNAEAYSSCIEAAEKHGVVILSENLLWGASKDPIIISELVKELKSRHFGWCFDTGHANCFGIQPSILHECAYPPLSLHIQDNNGAGRDEHLIPGDGTIDWNSVVENLKSVGYKGDCVLEAHHQSIEAPDNERDAILSRLLTSARRLRQMMEEDA